MGQESGADRTAPFYQKENIRSGIYSKQTKGRDAKLRGDGQLVKQYNSSTDVLTVTGACTSATAVATDGKTRMVINRKASGTFSVGGKTVAVGKPVFVNDSAVSDLTGFHPLGICLTEVGLVQEKGDEAKLSDGNDITIDKTSIQGMYGWDE